MKNKFMNLHIFEEGGNGGEGNTAGQNRNSGNGNGSQSGNVGYTFEQAEEIANNRAEKASRAALASFYRQQGLSEEQITTAIADFKAKQKAQQPDVDTITRERDAAQKELQELKNEKILTGKVSKLVDDKTDFTKAAEKFLKENPKYTGAGTYRVSTSTGSDNQDTGGSVNMNINDRIRAAARR